MSVVVPPGVHFSQFQFGGNPQAGDEVVGLRNGLNTRFDFSNFSGNSLSIVVTQPTAGLFPGDIMTINGAGVYILAMANNAVNANVVGIIDAILSANQFSLLLCGYIQNFVGLVTGAPYYLSAAVPGGSTNVVPVVPGTIYKPVFIALSTSTAVWLNYPGLVL